MAQRAVELALLRLFRHVLQEVNLEKFHRLRLDILSEAVCEHQEVQLDLVEVEKMAEVPGNRRYLI